MFGKLAAMFRRRTAGKSDHAVVGQRADVTSHPVPNYVFNRKTRGGGRGRGRGRRNAAPRSCERHKEHVPERLSPTLALTSTSMDDPEACWVE